MQLPTELRFLAAAFLLMAFVQAPLLAQDDASIALPKPVVSGGMPLMDALSKRSSQRAFSSKELSLQEISDLLWAADGVNRPDGRRTAPSTMNMKEIKIYVVLKAGIYLYDAPENKLKLLVAGDFRSVVGLQPFVKDAPLDLIYVVDFNFMGKVKDPLQKRLYAHVDSGFISQNVYLFCASKGLSTVVLGYIDRDVLAKRLALTETQEVTYAQPVGYPSDASKEGK